jgi:transcriptional regulator with XRE-family HTH domain
MTIAQRRKLVERALLLARRKKVTGDRIAERLGVSRQAVHNWAHGLCLPGEERALRLRALMGEWKTLPDPPPPRPVHIPESPVERLWKNIRRTPKCWIWTGQKNWLGYGFLKWYGRVTFAHQAILSLDGPWRAEGRRVFHACGRKLCVRPEHLVVVPRGVSVAGRRLGRRPTRRA